MQRCKVIKANFALLHRCSTYHKSASAGPWGTDVVLFKITIKLRRLA